MPLITINEQNEGKCAEKSTLKMWDKSTHVSMSITFRDQSKYRPYKLIYFSC